MENAIFLKYNKYHFYLSHFPTICSNYDDEGLKHCMIGLCGHTHTKDPFLDMDKGLIFHTEVDTNNCYPWLLDDIIEKTKEYLDNKKS
jgi:calcineurin-like phosphoesterase family protein